MPHPLAPADDTAIDPTADLSAILPRAARWASTVPLPGGGRTAELWRSLADLAAVDVELARIVEPHLDASAILAKHPTQKILFVSGYSETDAIKRIAPKAPLLHKPFRADALSKAVQRALSDG